MGATPSINGVAFRVWAPFADKVFVTGSFNNWAPPGILMNREEGGEWSQLVMNAKIGDEYRYIIENGGKLLSRNDPYARDVTGSTGNSVVCDLKYQWVHKDFTLPSPQNRVIYEMHVGTFHDEPGGPPGNFYSAIEKLGHLEKLGINVIEVMPAMEFAGGFSWGYNPAFIFAIESDYGGPQAFKEFIDAAHGRNMAVILDVVYNHWGPGDLGLWQFDGWHENNMGGIYFYNDWRSATPWGDTRPDYGRPHVRQYIYDNLLMWLEEYHVDGFRWDMTPYIRSVNGDDYNEKEQLAEGWSLMREINEKIHADYAHVFIIAEDLHCKTDITRKTSDGGADFDAQWNAAFVHPVREAMIAPYDHDRDMNKIANAIRFSYSNHPFSRIIYTESHDEVANGKARLPEEIWPGNADSWFSKKRSMLAAMLTMTSPGLPMLFQGQEMLMDKWFDDQSPIDWNFRFNFQGIFTFYQDLVALRLDKKGSSRGLTGPHVDVFHVNHQDKVIAYHRYDQGGPQDDVIILLNMSNQEFPVYKLGVPRDGEWIVRLDSDWKKYDFSFAEKSVTQLFPIPHSIAQFPFMCRLKLAPYSGIIISQDE